VRSRQQHDSSDIATEECDPFYNQATRAAHSTGAFDPGVHAGA
jgi:hypothetical protein